MTEEAGNSLPFQVCFCAGEVGEWRIDSVSPVIGASLEMASRLAVLEGLDPASGFVWKLRGIVSNARYTTAAELKGLSNVSPSLGRRQATRAALIPIKKSAAWWTMGQDERRAIFEDASRHIALSIDYLPAVARRLHHSRDLGEAFDFLTWFEYAPEHSDDFEGLVARLRSREEWKFVEREVDIRLSRMA